VPWGTKAFTGYLGPRSLATREPDNWVNYDACELLKIGHRHPDKIVIYQGSKDEFLGSQLQPDEFCKVAVEVGQSHELRWCEGYDHSYYFVQSFLPDALTRILT
jgi:S-formylglutathione hydrolase